MDLSLFISDKFYFQYVSNALREFLKFSELEFS